MSSMRFLAVKWGFKARHRGDDHAYSVISSKILEKSMDFVVGNIMLAAGFIAYIGP
mgnify:CR=1 FL=1